MTNSSGNFQKSDDRERESEREGERERGMERARESEKERAADKGSMQCHQLFTGRVTFCVKRLHNYGIAFMPKSMDT